MKRLVDITIALVGSVALALVTPVVLLGNRIANRGPNVETCNGEDDDCDGDFDEDCDCEDGEVQNCYGGPRGTENIGLCHGGTMTCEAGVFGRPRNRS